MYLPRSKFAYFLVPLLFAGIPYWSAAQSTLQDHPTPVTHNEINSSIKPRDLGDSRLTTHYYWFGGAQGDVFINLTSKNFAGDVDIFVQSGLRLLTKIVVYADFGEVETGRVIYLRKPERLLLRVQGRTPNDEAATYRLKFAGSFVAATVKEGDIPDLPTVAENIGGPVRVNSVGTILPPIPKLIELKAESDAKNTVTTEADRAASEKGESEKKVEAIPEADFEKKETPKLEVVVEDPVKAETAPKATSAARKPPQRRTRASRNANRTSTAKPPETAIVEPEKTEGTASPVSAAEKRKAEPKPDPLANVQLVIVFKDGGRIERPLPEVFRFSVDRGVLTVVSKDGRVGKYQMVDVAKVTIE